MKTFRNAVTVILALMLIASCGASHSKKDVMEVTAKDAREVASAIKDKLTDMGALKKLKGAGKEGAEFVSDIFTEAGMPIPRMVSDLARYGTKVKRDETRMGDLVFFKTGMFKKHVGIYIGMNRFVHSTPDEGVLVSNFKDPYWKDTYWQSRRILDF